MVQRLCNHKTGIHEVIILEFEIWTVCRDKSNIDFVLGQYYHSTTMIVLTKYLVVFISYTV